MGEFQKRLEAMQGIKLEVIQSMSFEMDDRSTIITSTGLLDDVLSLAIIHRFWVMPSDTQASQLFTGYGPLATMSAKIALGYHLGAIPKDAKHDLEIIKKMRNDYAHVYMPVSFVDKEIADRCKSLKSAATLTPQFQSKLPTNVHRVKFVRCVIRLYGLLIAYVAVSNEEKAILAQNRQQITDKATR
jgi:DNA-binding MltR family transcriptional regulator